MNPHRVGVSAILVVLALATASSSASGAPVHRRSEVSRSGFVLLASCPRIFMRSSIEQTTYQPGQAVNVRAYVENRGTTDCVFRGAGAASQQYIGPCGAFSMTVANDRGVSIWPGPVAPSCPAIPAVSLKPGRRIIATGAWPLTIGFTGFGPPAPMGDYRLLIGGSIEFTVRIG
jgi:hypothetical protein